ncbi:MAG: hypothetical protein ACYS32_04270 [Planctomycetota bacterium]|jgi:hypothetical protein
MLAANMGRQPTIPVLLLVLVTVCYIGSIACLGSENPEDSNSIRGGGDKTSSIAIDGNSPDEEDSNNISESDGEIGRAASSSSEEPNSAAETLLDTARKDVNMPGQSESGVQGQRVPSLTSRKMIAFYIAIFVAVIVTAGWFFLSKTGRTRLSVRRNMARDRDITDQPGHGGEFLIIFKWTQKVIFLPTIMASLIAATLMYLHEYNIWILGSMDPKIIGGVFFGIFFLNFLVEEYNIRLMVIITSLVSVGFLLLWLELVDWVVPFFQLFKRLAFEISGTGYLLVCIIGLLTILVSWIRGLFYYVVITPNYINIQEGLTETGEQIARRDFYTSVDTTDLVERLFGIGKINITFKESERKPMTLLVWRIGAKAEKLEEMGTKLIVT